MEIGLCSLKMKFQGSFLLKIHNALVFKLLYFTLFYVLKTTLLPRSPHNISTVNWDTIFLGHRLFIRRTVETFDPSRRISTGRYLV